MTIKIKKIKKRFCDYGFKVGFLAAGKKNSITDVEGVMVGHLTKIEGQNCRTGVTLIDPGVPNLYRQKLPAGIAVGNGFGKLTGISQVEELGTLEAPIALTNTLAVGKVMRGVVNLAIENTKDLAATETISPVVGETNDGLLNDIHADSVNENDVVKAYKNRSSDVEVGNVGAGTGTRAFSWKGGIGTSSRLVKVAKKTYTVGVVTQTNFGGSLSIMGVPIGQLLGNNDYPFAETTPDGSCMIVLATDAPLDARQLKRLAKRALLGMVRTGSIMATGSGDYAIAFSVTKSLPLNDSDLNPLFLAAVEAAEESIYDALFAAETMTGRNGASLKALPKEKVITLIKKYGRL